ncbi:MAG: tetratricopeptide repeat protein [Burkholderiaceae bacterium]
MPVRRLLQRLPMAAALAWCCTIWPALGQTAQPEPVENSTLDSPLFYQLLIGEIEMRAGRAGTAYEVVLDAAKRTGDDSLYQRAVDIALQARAGEQALAAAKAWRQAKPASVDARRYQIQILIALNRLDEVAEPLKGWISALPADQRSGLITATPRLLSRVDDRQKVATLLEQWLAPYRDVPETRTAARVAMARGWHAASNSGKALEFAEQAAADDPAAPGPYLLALDLMPQQPAAERIATQFLAQDKVDAPLRLAYVRALTQSQRYAEATQQLDIVTRAEPQLAAPWLTLGALRLDMRQFKEAEAALLRYTELAQKQPDAAADDDGADGDDRGLTQAWLLLAQIAEQRGDLKAAEGWLAKIDDPKRALEVQSRRATLLARQGKLQQARELIRQVPERTEDEGRAKMLAEAQVLREVKRWREAAEVLAAANKRFTGDADLLYEQAMVEDKLDRHADMERLLRQVIALKPDHAHAHNALGYSLADRSQRLDEARKLLQRALELQPTDPFIIDSMGWLEFRSGNRDEAVRLLRKAYSARPDTEIAAHLGEVLWATGRRDEARRIWGDARGRDAGNEVLRDTLARLRVHL